MGTTEDMLRGYLKVEREKGEQEREANQSLREHNEKLATELNNYANENWILKGKLEDQEREAKALRARVSELLLANEKLTNSWTLKSETNDLRAKVDLLSLQLASKTADFEDLSKRHEEVKCESYREGLGERNLSTSVLLKLTHALLLEQEKTAQLQEKLQARPTAKLPTVHYARFGKELRLVPSVDPKREPVRHELKTWPEYFDAVMSGKKTFEFRVQDRDFCVGDILCLQEWDPETKAYTGLQLHRKVSYLLEVSGYVVMCWKGPES